jgi:hypothetical protein
MSPPPSWASSLALPHGVRRCFTGSSNSGRHGERCIAKSRPSTVGRRLSTSRHAYRHRHRRPHNPTHAVAAEHHAQRSWTGQLVRSRAHAAARPTVQSHTCAWPWVAGPFPGPMPGCFNQQPHPRSAAPFCESSVGERRHRHPRVATQRLCLWCGCCCRCCCCCCYYLLLLLLLLVSPPPAADPDGPVDRPSRPICVPEPRCVQRCQSRLFFFAAECRGDRVMTPTRAVAFDCASRASHQQVPTRTAFSRAAWLPRFVVLSACWLLAAADRWCSLVSYVSQTDPGCLRVTLTPVIRHPPVK